MVTLSQRTIILCKTPGVLTLFYPTKGFFRFILSLNYKLIIIIIIIKTVALVK